MGCGFDCASKAELNQAIDLVTPKQIIYANPCKSPHYIEYALKIGVQKMTFDSAEELQKIYAISGGETK